MDHVKIIKRAWNILWSYKTLWIFGIILALTTITASERLVTLRGGDRENRPRPITIQPGEDALDVVRDDIKEGIEEMEEFFREEVPESTSSTLLTIGITLACVFTLLFIVAKFARYISETSLIRMVDDYEETGEQLTFKQGFHLGWSRAAWRLFLIDLAIAIPTILVFTVLFALILAPIYLLVIGNLAAGVLGMVLAVGFTFLTVLLGLLVAVALSLLKHFFRRVCALEDTGVIESIRKGFWMVQNNLKDVGLMWLIMIGVQLVYPLAVIPVVLLAIFLGLVIAGPLGLLVGGIAGLLLSGEAAVILGLSVGIPIFIIVVASPLVFLDGLRDTFISTNWTLTYRELRALKGLEPEVLPEIIDLDIKDAEEDETP
jgi:hypothetical protein